MVGCVRACSSIGQSWRLITARLQVRVLPGAPVSLPMPADAWRLAGCITASNRNAQVLDDPEHVFRQPGMVASTVSRPRWNGVMRHSFPRVLKPGLGVMACI